MGIPANFTDHTKLMFDLQVTAFQTDMTRVFTMIMARELSARTYANIGIPGQHHLISHHRDDPDMMSQKARIDTHHVEMLAYFLEKMAATKDAEGSLLDNSPLDALLRGDCEFAHAGVETVARAVLEGHDPVLVLSPTDPHRAGALFSLNELRSPRELANARVGFEKDYWSAEHWEAVQKGVPGMAMAPTSRLQASPPPCASTWSRSRSADRKSVV